MGLRLTLVSKLFWKTIGRREVDKLTKSLGYKRTIAVVLFVGVAVLRVLGHSGLATTAEQIGGYVGMTPEQVGAGASPVDVVALVAGVVGLGHWVWAAFVADKG